ncbi:MAG: phosphotransferase [Myxococcota bacterium]
MRSGSELARLNLRRRVGRPDDAAVGYAVQDFELNGGATRLLRIGLNEVYASRTLQGRAVVLRVTEGSRRTRDAIEAELLWMEHLARNECRVAAPVRARNGSLVRSYGSGPPRHVVVFEWVHGRDLWCRGRYFRDPEFQRKLGRVLGRLHGVSDSLELPSHLGWRPWHDVAMLPEEPPSGFDEATARAMRAHEQRMQVQSAYADPAHFGLCHGDVYGQNMLYDSGRISLLDFELGALHWRASDFTDLLLCDFFTPIWKMEGAEPRDARTFMENLAAGYREEHTLDTRQLELLPDLLGLREVHLYRITRNDPAKWDEAVSTRRGTHADLMTWMETRWRDGRPDYGVDFSGI